MRFNNRDTLSRNESFMNNQPHHYYGGTNHDISSPDYKYESFIKNYTRKYFDRLFWYKIYLDRFHTNLINTTKLSCIYKRAHNHQTQ